VNGGWCSWGIGWCVDCVAFPPLSMRDDGDGEGLFSLFLCSLYLLSVMLSLLYVTVRPTLYGFYAIFVMPYIHRLLACWKCNEW
jgi:hypothetical protein